MVDFYSLFASLESNGFYQFFLPFILVFAIVYAVLEKVALFKKGDSANTPANVIIALVVGLLMVSQFQIVTNLNNFIAGISFWLIVVVMFLILIGLFGIGSSEKGFGSFLLIFFTIAGIVIIYVTLAPVLNFQLPSWIYDNPGWIVMGVIFILVVLSLTGSFSAKKNDSPMTHMGEFLDGMFGRGGTKPPGLGG